MGIFSTIKNAVFGDDKDDAPTPSPTPSTGFGAAQDAKATTTVDVEQKLDAMGSADSLNWRTSIVDLLKLIGVDPSYENRKELATELGRADYSGSAEDNVWLHRQTMQELAKNGGRVPAEFLD